MSYRALFFTRKKITRGVEHRFRKFQVSKLPTYVETKLPTIKKTVEVEEIVEP